MEKDIGYKYKEKWWEWWLIAIKEERVLEKNLKDSLNWGATMKPVKKEW